MKLIASKLVITLLILLSQLNILNADIFSYTLTAFHTEAKDSLQAKNIALETSRKTAFVNTIKKIISSNDYEKLDSLIEGKQISFFETSISITDEEITRGAYKANLTYSFNQEKILKFLDENNIDHLLKRLSRYFVLIDVKDVRANDTKLWKNFWYGIKIDDFLSTFIVYEDQVSNSELTNDQILVFQDFFNASSSYWLTLMTGEEANSYSVTIKNINNLKSVVLTGFKTVEEAFFYSVLKIEEAEKQENLDLYSKNQGNSSFQVDISDFGSWVQIQNTLNSNASIQSFFIKEAYEDVLTVNIEFRGKLKDLQESFANQCVELNIYHFFIKVIPNCSL